MSAAESELPELQDQVLPWDTVQTLLLDLRDAAELLGVMVKGAPDAHATGAAPDLGAARVALEGGRGVQLRYRFQGTEWCDTLLPVTDGVRLVRIRRG
jgi:hypothetical protein